MLFLSTPTTFKWVGFLSRLKKA